MRLDDLSDVLRFLSAAFPDNRLTIDDMIAENDRVAVRWTAYNTHTGGEFMGIPPSGNTANIGGTTIYRLVNGRIAELWYNADVLGFLQQLGVSSPLG